MTDCVCGHPRSEHHGDPGRGPCMASTPTETWACDCPEWRPAVRITVDRYVPAPIGDERPEDLAIAQRHCDQLNAQLCAAEGHAPRTKRRLDHTPVVTICIRCGAHLPLNPDA
jgi:hypothetical protein